MKWVHVFADTHIGSDQYSLATSVLCSNVLIMIGFVCNYKHSETPISKSLIEFRPMGILGCFWKMHALSPTTAWTHAHTHPYTYANKLTDLNTSLQKQMPPSEMSDQLCIHLEGLLPKAPRSAQLVCACHVDSPVPKAQLLQRPGPVFFFCLF